jgi:hypothetical protein
MRGERQVWVCHVSVLAAVTALAVTLIELKFLTMLSNIAEQALAAR